MKLATMFGVFCVLCARARAHAAARTPLAVPKCTLRRAQKIHREAFADIDKWVASDHWGWRGRVSCCKRAVVSWPSCWRACLGRDLRVPGRCRTRRMAPPRELNRVQVLQSTNRHGALQYTLSALARQQVCPLLYRLVRLVRWQR